MWHRLFGACLALFWLTCCQVLASDVNPEVSVRVFCGHNMSACTLSSEAEMSLEQKSGQRLAGLPARATLRLEAAGAEIAASCSEPSGRGQATEYVVRSAAPIRVSPAEGGGRSYRGRLEVRTHEGELVVLNRVALEDYLRGVLGPEIPASFHPEALRAQAMVARTYALSASGRHGAGGYDLCDTSHCQVYLGTEGEKPVLEAAIRDTAHKVVMFEGKPIHAVYHAACGGRTAGNETAWAGSRPLPYLRPVSDCEHEVPWCGEAPDALWTRQMPQSRLGAALRSFRAETPIASIEVGERDQNGRPRDFRIRGKQGESMVLAGTLRAAVNSALGWDTLPSADFEAALNGDVVVFAGRGNGHGVGLCQWGANARAKAGWSAERILTFYYPGVSVEPMEAVTPQASEVSSGTR